MTLIFLVFLAALSIEAMGTYISVIGLSAAFAADPIIMAMAVSLDFAKVMLVSVSYKHWSKLSRLIRFYIVPATMILMIISSAGVAGYLSQSFQKAVLPNKDVTIKLEALEQEKSRLEERKLAIDKQIAQLPPNMVRGRQQLINSFKPEETSIRNRISELDVQVAEIKSKNAEIQAHIGPIAFISEAFGVTMEVAVKYVIALIVIVFDPLAVVLLIIGNFLLELKRKGELDSKVKNEETEILVLDPVDSSDRDSGPDVHPEISEPIPVLDSIVDSTPSTPTPDHVVLDEPVVEEEKPEVIEFVSYPTDDPRNRGTEIEFLPESIQESPELELVPIEEVKEEFVEPIPAVKSDRKFRAKEDVKDLLFLLPEEQVNEEKVEETPVEPTPEPVVEPVVHAPPRKSQLMSTKIVDGAKTIFNQ